MKPLLLLAAWGLAAPSEPFLLGKEALTAGRPGAALEHLMDALTLDPKDREARKLLRQAGEALIEEERRRRLEARNAEEREADIARAVRAELEARRLEEEVSWRLAWEEALELARSEERLSEALTRYETLLDDTPPYLGSLKAVAEFSGRFHRNLSRNLAEFEGLPPRELGVGELAGSLIVRQAAPADLKRDWRRLEGELDRARRLGEKEADLRKLAELVRRAEPYDRRVPSSEALAAWRRVQLSWPRLEEARRRVESLERRLALLSGPPAAPAGFGSLAAGTRVDSGSLTGARTGRQPARALRASPKELSLEELEAAAAAAPAAPAGGDGLKAGESYREGLRAYAAQDLARAAEGLRRALALDPSHERARRALDLVERELAD